MADYWWSQDRLSQLDAIYAALQSKMDTFSGLTEKVKRVADATAQLERRQDAADASAALMERRYETQLGAVQSAVETIQSNTTRMHTFIQQLQHTQVPLQIRLSRLRLKSAQLGFRR